MLFLAFAAFVAGASLIGWWTWTGETERIRATVDFAWLPRGYSATEYLSAIHRLVARRMLLTTVHSIMGGLCAAVLVLFLGILTQLNT